MAVACAYRVTVRHNLVLGVESIDAMSDQELPTDNLEVTLTLAQNYRQNGCIDGEYLFSSVHQAKDFALVALDFVKKLTEKSEHVLSEHNFYAEPDWRNSLVGIQEKMQH